MKSSSGNTSSTRKRQLREESEPLNENEHESSPAKQSKTENQNASNSTEASSNVLTPIQVNDITSLSRNKIKELETELAAIKERLSALENNIQISNSTNIRIAAADNVPIATQDNIPPIPHRIIPLSYMLPQFAGIQQHRQIALVPPNQHHVHHHGSHHGLNIMYLHDSDSENDDNEAGDGEFDEEARELFLHLQHLIQYHGARII